MSLSSRVCNSVSVIVAAAWFGGVVTMALVLPMLFASEELTRDQAGSVAGRVLLRFDQIVLVLLAVLWVFWLGTGLATRISRKALLGTGLLLIILTASRVGSMFVLRPAMDELRTQIVSFDRSAPQTPARQQFNTLHRVAEGLMVVDLIGLAILLAIRPGWGPRRGTADPSTMDT